MPTDESALHYLSPAEWRIFYAFSKAGAALTLRELGSQLTRLDPDFSLAYSSIHTLVKRLIEKGYVASRSSGSGVTSTRFFWPLIPFDAALRAHAERFLSQFVFDDPGHLKAVRDLVDEHLAALADSIKH